ncbi:MAG: hypothetical protein QM698_07690 [Micropepsaceae bacterium]
MTFNSLITAGLAVIVGLPSASATTAKNPLKFLCKIERSEKVINITFDEAGLLQDGNRYEYDYSPIKGVNKETGDSETIGYRLKYEQEISPQESKFFRASVTGGCVGRAFGSFGVANGSR